MRMIRKKAQAGLEYLMTYGWALVLIASIIGVFVVLVGMPTGQISFTSSDPTKFLVRGGTIDSANKVEVVLRNATGGKITVTSPFTLTSTFGDRTGDLSKLNGVNRTSISSSAPVVIIAGGELRFSNIKYAGTGTGTISMNYTDVYNFARTLTVSGRKGAANLCGNGTCDAGEDPYTCPSDCP